MPRRPRVFVEGGIYHVYNRFARGAEILVENDEAERFLGLLRAVKRRDGLTVFAWCLMSNHYHLALRTGPIPLSRSIGYVQARFGQQYNRRRRSTGPLWQSRYKARLVEDSRYLGQLVAYIHLNPVMAELVDDPADYPRCGHIELIKNTAEPLVDRDETLGMYGDTLQTARRHYVRALQGVRTAEWREALPGRLPWWKHEADRPLAVKAPDAWVDEQGVSTGRERAELSAREFVALACRALEADVGELQGNGYGRRASRQRILLAAVGVERWRQSARELGRILGRRGDVISRWVRWGAARRQGDPGFGDAYDDLDRELSTMVGS